MLPEEGQEMPPEARSFGERLAKLPGLGFPEDFEKRGYLSLPAEDWVSRVEELVQALRE